MRSEEFNEAIWQKNAVTIEANAIAAPNGTITADKIQETAVTNYFAVIQNPTALTSATYTFSVYAKSAERSRIFVRFSALSNVRCDFDLANGSAVSPGSGLLSSSIQAIKDGWFRCSITFSTPSSGSNLLYHLIGVSSGVDVYASIS